MGYLGQGEFMIQVVEQRPRKTEAGCENNNCIAALAGSMANNKREGDSHCLVGTPKAASPTGRAGTWADFFAPAAAFRRLPQESEDEGYPSIGRPRLRPEALQGPADIGVRVASIPWLVVQPRTAYA